jgi:hypothetical protein
MKLVALVYQICYFCVYFCQHRFHLETDSTAPFRGMVLISLQLLLCLYLETDSTAPFRGMVLISLQLLLSLYLLFIFLNRRVLFCGTGYSISIPVWISV